jgi:DNA-binding PadR family transcriptional regulator
MEQHDFLILLAVLDRGRHGYAIIQTVAERTGGDVALGTSTVYAALKRLSTGGLIAETDRPADEPSGDERRRYYRATARGRAVAREQAARIRQLHDLARSARLLGPAKGRP